MKRGKARNSHDTIQYAINGWATFALHDFGFEAHNNIHHACKIKLYNLISELFAGSIQKIKLKS